MPAARIDPLDPPYDPDIDRIFAAIMPPGVDPLVLFRIVARNPRIMKKLHAGGLLDRGSISLREREIVIDRTTARCGAEYEWGVHVAFFGAKVRFTGQEIEATVVGAADDPAWSASEAALIRLVDALHDTATVDDETFAAVSEHFSPEQIVEAIALTGYYHMISFLVNGLDVPREPGTPAFPARPAGRNG
jgi:alkylhydroperoxidase family enzyme